MEYHMNKTDRGRIIATNVVGENRHTLVGIEWVRARRYRGILDGRNKEFAGSEATDSVFRRQHWPFVT